MRHSRGPKLDVSCFKTRVSDQNLDTLSATRADPIFPFNALKSMFLVRNQTLYAPLADPNEEF